MPHTFSFRLNESSFSEDLQNFAKLFLAVEKSKSVNALIPIDTFHDKYSREHCIYYDFECRTYQRPPPGLNKKGKFLNMKAENIFTRNFPTLFASKNLWMIKPSGMSRGRGIELFTKLDELKTLIECFTRGGVNSQDYSVLGYKDDQAHSPTVNFDNDSQSKFSL